MAIFDKTKHAIFGDTPPAPVAAPAAAPVASQPVAQPAIPLSPSCQAA